MREASGTTATGGRPSPPESWWGRFLTALSVFLPAAIFAGVLYVGFRFALYLHHFGALP